MCHDRMVCHDIPEIIICLWMKKSIPLNVIGFFGLLLTCVLLVLSIETCFKNSIFTSCKRVVFWFVVYLCCLILVWLVVFVSCINSCSLCTCTALSITQQRYTILHPVFIAENVTNRYILNYWDFKKYLWPKTINLENRRFAVTILGRVSFVLFSIVHTHSRCHIIQLQNR